MRDRFQLYAFSHASRTTCHTPFKKNIEVLSASIHFYPLLALILASCSSGIPARGSLFRSPRLHTCRSRSSARGPSFISHFHTHFFFMAFGMFTIVRYHLYAFRPPIILHLLFSNSQSDLFSFLYYFQKN